MNEENKKTLAGIIIFAVVVIAVIIILLLRGCGAKEYKVTFDSNGGTAISEIIVKENETITKPADPTREGYVFVGWYYNDELFDFSTKITKDMVLEARWAEIDGDKITLNVTSEEDIKSIVLNFNNSKNSALFLKIILNSFFSSI